MTNETDLRQLLRIGFLQRGRGPQLQHGRVPSIRGPVRCLLIRSPPSDPFHDDDDGRPRRPYSSVYIVTIDDENPLPTLLSLSLSLYMWAHDITYSRPVNIVYTLTNAPIYTTTYHAEKKKNKKKRQKESSSAGTWLVPPYYTNAGRAWLRALSAHKQLKKKGRTTRTALPFVII